MYTLRHNTDESIVLVVDEHEIIITLQDISSGAVKLDIRADNDVKIIHKIPQEEFVD